jgi:hypothetical protein
VKWRLRLLLQPESRRTRKLFRARSPDVGSDVSMKIGYVTSSMMLSVLWLALFRVRHKS